MREICPSDLVFAIYARAPYYTAQTHGHHWRYEKVAAIGSNLSGEIFDRLNMGHC